MLNQLSTKNTDDLLLAKHESLLFVIFKCCLSSQFIHWPWHRIEQILLESSCVAEAKWESQGTESSDQWCDYLQGGHGSSSSHQSHWKVWTSGTAWPECFEIMDLWLLWLHVVGMTWSGYKINTIQLQRASDTSAATLARANNVFVVPFIL